MSKVFVIGLSGESIFLKVDHFHKLGETLHAKTLNTECGGKGYNQAVALKKFGSRVSYLSAIGKDVYGDKCEAFLDSQGIKSFMIRKDIPTALATILTNECGDNEVTVFTGATNLLDEEDVLKVESEIASSDYLLLQLEVPLKANLKAVEIAKKNNVKIVINPAPAQNYTLELLQSVDIITPNEEEAKTIFKVNNLLEINNKMADMKIKEVVVTCGSEGALHFKNGKINKSPTLKVKAIDTTGAGDTFNAMLVYKLSNGCDTEESIKWANVAASLSATKKGVMDSIPTLSGIKEKLKENESE